MEHLSWLWTHGALAWIAALGLFLGVGLWRAVGAPKRRGRRYFGRQLAALRRAYPLRRRAPVQRVEHLGDGALQLLMGRLRVEGDGCDSYDAGAQVAASTVACTLSGAARGERERGATIALSRRARKLWLDLDGGSVRLLGDVEVLVGARQVHPRRRLHNLPRGLCERVIRDRPPGLEPTELLREPPVIRNLSGGETVIAFGRVSADGAASSRDAAARRVQLQAEVQRDRAQPAEPGPYRAGAARRWTLEAAVGDASSAHSPAVSLLYADAPELPIPALLRFAVYPMGWVAAGLVGLLFVGSLSLRVAVSRELVPQASPHADGAPQLVLRHDQLPLRAPMLSLAAATPMHRARALSLLADALAHSEQRGRALVEARAAAELLAGRCAAAASVWREHHQPERAVALLARCEATGAEARAARHVAGLAWMDQGAYRRASAVFGGLAGDQRGADDGAGSEVDRLDEIFRYQPLGSPAQRAAWTRGPLPKALGLAYARARLGWSAHSVAHLLAGEWHLAAQSLRRVAAVRSLSGDEMAAYTCLAEAASYRAGEALALSGLEARAQSFRSPVCAILAADLDRRPGATDWLRDRRIRWDVMRADLRGQRLLYLRELLLLERQARGGVGPTGADTIALLSAGVPNRGTPYESLPGLESAVLEALSQRPEPPRRDRILRMAMAARSAGLAAHLGQHERAATLRARVLADAERLIAVNAGRAENAGQTSAPANAGADEHAKHAEHDEHAKHDAGPWRALRANALLLVAVTHWRAGQLDEAHAALAEARDAAPAALLARVESVLAFEARREVQASLVSVLTGGQHNELPTESPDNPTALARALAGDGAALAALIDAERVIPNALGMLAPGLTSGHERLRELVRWGARADQRRSTADALWLDGARAFAAERLGDHTLAERVREVAANRYLALSDRDAAVLVYILEQLRPTL